ncbi:hypothetical protein C9F11_21550 [Streptomyces sp. YIM 121038]|uniref:hypothetical protein n=1 Tax=Streptomyces sp. YIM 121038 TaxID=2136401 RepID=UPI001110AEBC|nr:hypothetical protein [Streptomyces sp. YIM 121038]QCX77941.1 hypothetical protein C9F11_21550 [Streptomyces sp. YIM 121038]
MSNVFSGGSYDLDLSHGATAVFIDVLMLVASDLASEDWDFCDRPRQGPAGPEAGALGGGLLRVWPTLAW